ncbi:MAG: DUF308 domain-containing protein [Anaerolineae bacterium]|mgnify:CR=1 FL=1
MFKNSPWWLGLIQGLVALGAGLYLLVDPTGARFLIGLLAAIYLLVTGLIYTVRGIIARRPGKSSLLLIRGIVGLVVGGVLVLMALFDIGTLDLGYTILAIGLILFGGMGLFSSLFKREGKSFAWGPVIVSGALLAWGLIVLFLRSSINLPAVSGWILVIIGVVIIAYTMLGRKEPTSEAV